MARQTEKTREWQIVRERVSGRERERESLS